MRKENNFIIKLSTLNYRLSPKGLTLIEVMIVVAILAVISSTLFSVFQSSLFSQRKGTNKAIIYSEARAALDMMSREIEKAFVDERIGAKCLGQDGSGIGVDISDTFLFIAPLNPNNDNSPPDYTGELCEVEYRMSTEGTIQRRYISAKTDFVFDNSGRQPLIGNVSNLQFEYFNGQQWIDGWDDAGDSTLVLPRAIKITLVMQYEPEKDRDDIQDTFITIVNIPGSGQ